MAEYMVEYDFTESYPEYAGDDPETGEPMFETVTRDGNGVTYVTAFDEDEAIEFAQSDLEGSFENFQIWSVVRSDD